MRDMSTEQLAMVVGGIGQTESDLLKSGMAEQTERLLEWLQPSPLPARQESSAAR